MQALRPELPLRVAGPVAAPRDLTAEIRKVGLLEVAQAVASDHGVSLLVVLSPCRRKETVKARRALAHVFSAAGMSRSAIGRMIHRDHKTVLSLLRRRGWA